MKNLSKGKKTELTSNRNHIKPFLGLHRSIDEAIDNFFNFMSPLQTNLNQFEKLTMSPAMDITETSDNFTVEVEMPGMAEDDIKVTVENGRLDIHGEKSTSKKNKNKKYLSREISYGSYDRSISLPPTVNTSKAKAKFEKGLLCISIPKSGEKTKIKHISIEKK